MVSERVCVIGRVLCGLTIAVFLTAFPETGVEVSESKLVFTRLPDVVNRVGQLPLPDLGQLVPPGRRQRAVVGVLSGTLCVTQEDDDERSILGTCSCLLLSWIMELLTGAEPRVHPHAHLYSPNQPRLAFL